MSGMFSNRNVCALLAAAGMSVEALGAVSTIPITIDTSVDIRGINGKVNWVHHGANPPQTIEVTRPQFALGNGQVGAAAANTSHIAGHTQISEWDIRAYFDNRPIPGGPGVPPLPAARSRFGKVAEPVGVAVRAPGFVQATALPPGAVVKSEATTTFSAGGNLPDGTVIKIPPIAAGAAVGAGGGGGGGGGRSADSRDATSLSEARGSNSFYLNGVLAMEVTTHLWANDSASGLMDDTGLSLRASPGVASGFSYTATNFLDPSQSYSWSVGWDGVSLSAAGVNSGLFAPVPGGFSLAAAFFPGGELSLTAAGDSSFDAVATAHAVESGAIPTPGAIALFATAVGLAVSRRRVAAQS